MGASRGKRQKMFLTVAGWVVAPVMTLIIGFLVGKLRKNDQTYKALRSGVQALLRDRLIAEYKRHKANGRIDLDDKANFENMYQQYHSLEQNGVMDSIRDEVMAMPT